jgi:hypothetical protein
MKNEQTKPKLSKLICKYLNHHGKKTMQSLLHSPKSQDKMAAMIHNKLGWDNFFEGQIAAIWVEHRVDNICNRKLKHGGGKWARGLISKLLQITHQQWMYRNATVHLKIKDGCTVVQHQQALDNIERCLDTDPEEMLREHSHLLFTNFKNLATGPIKDKQQWLAEFKAARSAAHHVEKGSKVALRMRYS